MRSHLLAAISGEHVAAIGRTLAHQAVEGDTAAAKIILEYVVGRPAQQIELSGLDGEPLGISFDRVLGAILVAVEPYGIEARVAVAAKIRELIGDGAS
jgi:hypothetical protein